jgi:hypothetical protein
LLTAEKNEGCFVQKLHLHQLPVAEIEAAELEAKVIADTVDDS